eukprot:2172398-Prorocentrum_lima.AAC.1
MAYEDDVPSKKWVKGPRRQLTSTRWADLPVSDNEMDEASQGSETCIACARDWITILVDRL